MKNKGNNFGIDILSGTLGTIIAYALGFMFLPLITRYYLPEHIGTWQILLGFVSVLIPLVTLRFETALVLEKSIIINRSLISVVLFNTVLVVSILFAAYFYMGSEEKMILNLTVSKNLFFLAGIGVTLQSIFYVFDALIVKHKQFKAQAISKILKALVIPFVLFSALLVIEANAMVYMLAGLLAIMMQSLFLFYFVRKKYFKNILKWKKLEVIKAIKKYKVYPLYMVPYALSQGLIWQIILISLGVLFSASTVGAYAIAKQLVYMPVSLLSAGLRQAVFSYASSAPKYDKDISNNIRNLLVNIINISIPFAVFGFFYLPDLMNLVLGAGWEKAGEFSRWMLVSAVIAMQTEWLSRILDVYSKQKLAVFLQICSDIMLIFILFICYLFEKDALTTVASISIFLAIYELIWLFVVLRILKFETYFWLTIIFRITSIASIFSLFIFTTNLILPSMLAIVFELLTLITITYFIYLKLKMSFFK